MSKALISIGKKDLEDIIKEDGTKEDKEEVVNAISEMVRTKKYNNNLWG